MYKGFKHSEESKKKMSLSASKRLKGCRWWTDGTTDHFCKECPGPEFHLGKSKSGWNEERKRKQSEMNKGNKYAVASWNWWAKG